MKKILLVEDEKYISDMYKMKFAMSGYETIIAEDGERGWALAMSEKPDLILLDIMLPKLDGYEVLAKLKASEETKNIKVYLLSNLGQNGEVNKGFSGGADGFMVKADMTPSQLVKNVDEIFEGKTIGVKRPAPEIALREEEKRVDKIIGKVLLVEDSEVLSGMYRLAMEKAGFEVETADNGVWGIKLANTKKFDIIIMDIVMPAMKGNEAIKTLKAGNNTKKIPVIVLSNSAQDRDQEEAKKMGAASFLLKSQITPSKLVSEIKKVLKI